MITDRLTVSETVNHILHEYGVLKTKKTIYNWMYSGLRKGKLKLKHEKIAGVCYTRKSWVKKFVERCDR